MIPLLQEANSTLLHEEGEKKVRRMKTLRLVVNMLIALFLLLAACSVNLTPTETPPSTSIVKNRPSKQIQPPKVAQVEGIAATSSYIDTLVVTLMPTSSI